MAAQELPLAQLLGSEVVSEQPVCSGGHIAGTWWRAGSPGQEAPPWEELSKKGVCLKVVPPMRALAGPTKFNDLGIIGASSLCAHAHLPAQSFPN